MVRFSGADKGVKAARWRGFQKRMTGGEANQTGACDRSAAVRAGDVAAPEVVA
jgi:hypothetical protein